MWVSSFCLFDYAVVAHKFTVGGYRETPADRHMAIPAIVFAAASLEAFINELGAFALLTAEVYPDDLDVRTAHWIELFQALEANRASVESKFTAAKRLLTPEPFDKGRQPFQDFQLLFRLRNGLMHMRVEEHTIEGDQITIIGSDLLAPCRDKKLILGPGPPEGLPWWGQIQTEPMARWACNTASAMVHEIRRDLLDLHLQQWFDHHFSDQFQPRQ